MTVKEVLIEAKSNLTPETWGQGITGPGGMLAYGKCCAGMAIERVCRCTSANNSRTDLGNRTVAALLVGANCKTVSMFNDTHTYEQVMAQFDAAIAREE